MEQLSGIWIKIRFYKGVIIMQVESEAMKQEIIRRVWNHEKLEKEMIEFLVNRSTDISFTAEQRIIALNFLATIGKDADEYVKDGLLKLIYLQTDVGSTARSTFRKFAKLRPELFLLPVLEVLGSSCKERREEAAAILVDLDMGNEVIELLKKALVGK